MPAKNSDLKKAKHKLNKIGQINIFNLDVANDDGAQSVKLFKPDIATGNTAIVSLLYYF